MKQAAEGVVLSFEVALCLNDLGVAWDVALADLLVAVEIVEHCEFLVDSFLPEWPIDFVMARLAESGVGVRAYDSFGGSSEVLWVALWEYFVRDGSCGYCGEAHLSGLWRLVTCAS